MAKNLSSFYALEEIEPYDKIIIIGSICGRYVFLEFIFLRITQLLRHLL